MSDSAIHNTVQRQAAAAEDSANALRRCTELLEALVSDRALLMALPIAERERLLMAAGRVSRPQRADLTPLIRAARKQRRQERRSADAEARSASGIRTERQAPVFVTPQRIEGATRTAGPATRLETPRHCYVCKTYFQDLHFFYDSMCARCGDFNYEKRFQSAALDGRVALITGARVKIGYQAALMMLRAGARVIVTTRFPHDAAQRYATETDFEAWSTRLQIHGLDLRHAPSVELFTRYLDTTLDRLDILINNAAQTVRRPPGFYRHLLPTEALPMAALSSRAQQILESHAACVTQLEQAEMRSLAQAPAYGSSLAALASFDATQAKAAGLGLRSSAALSQIPYSLGDANLGAEVFPSGALDADLQQIDLRKLNSWRLTLADVPTAEMVEVQLVNAVAPFILCSKLKPLMLRQATADKHIVNVSAVEGQFSRRTKTDKHPHTNMAKAALNMMTLTSAPDYRKDGIHMNAVDTGWVTDEDPAEITKRKQDEIDFHPPLDIVDGAARICDPFFSGLLTGEHASGQFLKDYVPVKW